LQQKRLKATPQRIAVYDALKADKSHPSPETIYTRVYKKFPTISRATVYNILETFEKNGFVSVISSHQNTIRYDPLMDQHHHIVCKSCNKIVDLVDNELDNLTVPEQVKNENKLIGFRIHFSVICPECQ
jgi:Fur family peroxide stress response transcriptional regulator